MKKILSIILAIVMICSLFALAACSGDKDTGGSTTTPSTDTPTTDTPAGGETQPGGETPEAPVDFSTAKPNEMIREKLDAGEEVIFAVSLQSLDEQQQTMFNDGFKKAVEAEGFTYQYADSGNNIMTQVNQCENFLEYDPAIIFCYLGDVEPFETVCKQAQENGTYFVIQGAWAEYEPSGQAIMDQYNYGKAMGDAAIAWLDERYPDAEEVKVAFLCTTFMIDNVNTINGIEEVITADPRVNIVYKNENVRTIDEGFDATEDAFTMDSDIRLVIAITPTAGIGANNFIVSQPGINLDEYGIVFRGDNPETQALLAQGATNDGSVVRSLGGAGGNTFWETATYICKALLYGEEQEPFVTPERYYMLSNFGYNFDSRPAA